MLTKMDGTQALRNKALRGQIMRTLSLFYPDSTTISNVRTALLIKGQNNVAETESHLHYLKGKGYIEVCDGISKDCSDDDMVTLTSKGVDLIEGSIEDPGVML